MPLQDKVFKVPQVVTAPWRFTEGVTLAVTPVSAKETATEARNGLLRVIESTTGVQTLEVIINGGWVVIA